jgi:hypothetical protein
MNMNWVSAFDPGDGEADDRARGLAVEDQERGDDEQRATRCPTR